MKNANLFGYLPRQENSRHQNRKLYPFSYKHKAARAIQFSMVFLLFTLFVPQASAQNIPEKYEGKIKKTYVFGFTHVKKEKVDESYNAGYSMYVAAWPILKEYPGRSFQSGLFGTWMHPVNEKPAPIERFYTTIEGGLGWWRAKRFLTETPKFTMGGVQLNFSAWANGPGAGKGRDWDKPQGKYGVAQLSPWVLYPPDALNLKEGTCGELFGYGYHPLPLTEPKETTAGKEVPTGNQCWTLFLNTGNFKGPLAFFLPYFWTRPSVEDPRLSGMFLDQRPVKANRGISMETQHIPGAEATDSEGNRYVRVTKTQYPVEPDGTSQLMHRLMVYNKKALWDDVEAWFDGGDPVDGTFDPEGADMQDFIGLGRNTWRIQGDHIPKEKRAHLNVNSYFNSEPTEPATCRISWDLESEVITTRETKNGTLVILPEYYRFVKDGDQGRWVAVAPEDVPEETGLHEVAFHTPEDIASEAYVTPDEEESSWKTPGPAAGPFKKKLGDGSTVTYYWCRFADQPALLNADMTKAEREEMQRRVEMIHRNWKKDGEYLPPPTIKKELADIDPALIVTPPEGMEIGYVPIVTKQEKE